MVLDISFSTLIQYYEGDSYHPIERELIKTLAHTLFWTSFLFEAFGKPTM